MRNQNTPILINRVGDLLDNGDTGNTYSIGCVYPPTVNGIPTVNEETAEQVICTLFEEWSAKHNDPDSDSLFVLWLVSEKGWRFANQPIVVTLD